MIGMLEDAFGSYAAPLTLTALLTFAAAVPLPLARAPRARWWSAPMAARAAGQRGR